MVRRGARCQGSHSNDITTDGRLQIAAGVTLLRLSRLVRWHEEQALFVPVPRDEFEKSWRREVDPVFGRLLSWIAFSSGAEFWLKGLCLLHNIDIRCCKQVPQYPSGNLEDWAAKFIIDENCNGIQMVTSFGTLGNITKSIGNAPSKLDKLLNACNATDCQRNQVKASYLLLQKSIRNRDAHGYVRNVRDSHYHLVPNLFSECFNTTAEWLPHGRCSVTKWVNLHGFVASVD